MPGFIPGSRGSFMLDLVAAAMFLILPVLGYAIMESKIRKRYQSHKRLMVGIAVVLLLAVIAFEIEMRLVGWRQLAATSPFTDNYLPWALGVHLCFSVSTVFLIAITVVNAFRRFDGIPRPNQYSTRHKKIGKAAAIGLCGTSITGWIFYYMAFIAG